MLSKLSKRGVLLFTGVLALAAFVMPSAASAASWGVVGTTHVLDAPGLSFTDSGLAGGAGSSCAETQFDVDVRSATTLTITNALFNNCAGTGAATNCRATAAGTTFPWTVTGPTTTNIQIHNVHVTVVFENSALLCPLGSPASVTVFGTLTGGHWDAAAHQVTFNDADGLTANGPGFTNHEVTVRGIARDTAQTLVLS